MRSHCIIGLDPGTTVGYAVMNLQGVILELTSSKDYRFEDLLKEVVSFGKIVAVGTDMNPAPKFIQKFASTLNVPVVLPEKPLLQKYKGNVVKRYLRDKKIKIKNKHQRDALSAAILTWKYFKPLFNRVDLFLDKKDESHLGDRVKDFVINNKIPIKKAYDLIERQSI